MEFLTASSQVAFPIEAEAQAIHEAYLEHHVGSNGSTVEVSDVSSRRDARLLTTIMFHTTGVLLVNVVERNSLRNSLFGVRPISVTGCTIT